MTNPAEDSTLNKGRVTRELLENVLPPSGNKDLKVFCCGPPAMENALLGSKSRSGLCGGILGELGYTKDQVFKF